MALPVNRRLALLCAPLLAFAFAACGSTSSVTGFKGEERAVAQTIASLQTDATGRDEQKICTNILAKAVVARLELVKGRCKEAMNKQLGEIDTFEVTVESVQVDASAAPPTATASVKNVRSGKTRLSTVSLVKEAGTWKISSLS
jgi:Domain of unknown function (DUF4878)